MEQRDHTARLLLCHFCGVLGVEDGVYPSSEDFLFFIRHCLDMLVLEGVLAGGYRCLQVCVDAFLERTLVDFPLESFSLGRDFFGEDTGFVHEGHISDMFNVVSEVGHVPTLLAEGL